MVTVNAKAIRLLTDNKNIDKIKILDRDNKKKDGYHDGGIGSYNLIKDLKKINFDKVFIFNSSLRFNLISKFAGIKEIYQYPLFKKKNQHLINTAKEFIKKKIDIEVESNPKIELSKDSIMKTKCKYKIDHEQINIIMSVGGSGHTKRIPSTIFIHFMSIIRILWFYE